MSETLDFFVEVIWRQGRPVSDLLNAQVTILDRELAEFYGLDANLVEGPKPYDLTGNPHRGGLLTQASVLTLGGDDASMVSRGLFVLDDLLRGVVNAPPPCVNTTPPQTAFGLTQRAIAESRIKDATCGVCHARFEPLAFGLEKFDGIGAGVYAADWVFTLFSRFVNVRKSAHQLLHMLSACVCAARVLSLLWPKSGTVFSWLVALQH